MLKPPSTDTQVKISDMTTKSKLTDHVINE